MLAATWDVGVGATTNQVRKRPVMGCYVVWWRIVALLSCV